MKIKITTERECCQWADLKPVVGPNQPKKGYDPIWMFCQHCGRHHKMVTFMDAAGSSDWRYDPHPYPWDK